MRTSLGTVLVLLLFAVGVSPSPAASIVGIGGKCLDVQAGGSEGGTPIVLSSCNGSASQQWTFSGPYILGISNKCLDVRQAIDADGTPIILGDCHNGENQRWRYQDGYLVGLSGKCLDFQQANVADGSPIILFSCHGGDNQRWSVVETPPETAAECHAPTDSLVGARVTGTNQVVLPEGCQLYVFAAATGAQRSSGLFQRGTVLHLDNLSGYMAAQVAWGVENANSYSTDTYAHAVGGFAVSRFRYAQGFYVASTGSSASSATLRFVLAAPALVAIAGMAGSQDAIEVSGVNDLIKDAPQSGGTPPIGLEIVHAMLPAGIYSITEQSRNIQSGAEPNSDADLLTVFVFSDVARAASSPNSAIPMQATGAIAAIATSAAMPPATQQIVLPPTPAPSKTVSQCGPIAPRSFDVPAAQPWFHSGIQLCAGQSIAIAASGSIQVRLNPGPQDMKTPDGDRPIIAGTQPVRTPFVAPDLFAFSLVGRIGDDGVPFEVGSGPTTISAATAGELELSVNDNWFPDNAGTWRVSVARPTASSVTGGRSINASTYILLAIGLLLIAGVAGVVVSTLRRR